MEDVRSSLSKVKKEFKTPARKRKACVEAGAAGERDSSLALLRPDFRVMMSSYDEENEGNQCGPIVSPFWGSISSAEGETSWAMTWDSHPHKIAPQP